MTIDYSVIIRTTGQAGEKYTKLLESIKKLKPQPREIIVVLPEKANLPENQLGYEKFFYSPKGMILQRMCGIAKCKTRYGLICDDDVVFEEEFVQKLYKPIFEDNYRMSIAPLYSFFPAKGINSLICTIMASAIPTFFHKDCYNVVLRTTGYSYNRNLDSNIRPYYDTQSAPWTCFFAEIDAIKEIDFEKELWLDSHGYSALDDQTMFYKAWLRGIKTAVVPDAVYQHLDAKTSTKNNKPAFLYSSVYNRIIFWHRFIFKQQRCFGKVWSVLCIGYRLFWMLLLDIIDLIRNRMTYKELKIKIKAFFDGCRYLQSKEYQKMDSVC